MALVLSGSIWPDNSVNDCLGQLVAKAGGVVELDKVYFGRQARVELATVLALSSISNVPADTPIQGMSYDYIGDVLVRIDGDYDAAERRVNDVSADIIKALWGPNEPYWSDCYVYSGSQNPASPADLVGYRRGILYIRVIPR